MSLDLSWTDEIDNQDHRQNYCPKWNTPNEIETRDNSRDKPIMEY